MMQLDTTNNEVVLVPDAEPSEHLGLQVHWRLSGVVEIDKFHQALKSINLPEHLYPGESGDTKYVRRALEQMHDNKHRNLVRRLDKKAGFSLVAERAEALDLDEDIDEGGDPVDAHEIKMTAKVIKHPDGSTSLKVTPADHPDAAALRTEYERQRTLYHCGTDLSQWLTQKIIPYCNGLSGRDRGGFYYIPAGEDVTRFEAIVSMLKAVSNYGIGNRLLSGFKIYLTPAIMADSVVEAVVDSLIEETDKVCDDLDKKLEAESIGLRGWATQQDVARDLEKKVAKYSKLLNKNFDDLTERLSDLRAGMGVVEAKLLSAKEQQAIDKAAEKEAEKAARKAARQQARAAAKQQQQTP